MPKLRRMDKNTTNRLAFELLEIMDSCARIPGQIKDLTACLKGKKHLIVLKAVANLRGELDPHLRDHIRNACRVLDTLFAGAYAAAKEDGMSDDDIGVGLSKLPTRVAGFRKK